MLVLLEAQVHHIFEFVPSTADLTEPAGYPQSTGLWKISTGKDRFSTGPLLNSKRTFYEQLALLLEVAIVLLILWEVIKPIIQLL